MIKFLRLIPYKIIFKKLIMPILFMVILCLSVYFLYSTSNSNFIWSSYIGSSEDFHIANFRGDISGDTDYIETPYDNTKTSYEYAHIYLSGDRKEIINVSYLKNINGEMVKQKVEIKSNDFLVIDYFNISFPSRLNFIGATKTNYLAGKSEIQDVYQFKDINEKFEFKDIYYYPDNENIQNSVIQLHPSIIGVDIPSKMILSSKCTLGFWLNGTLIDQFDEFSFDKDVSLMISARDNMKINVNNHLKLKGICTYFDTTTTTGRITLTQQGNAKDVTVTDTPLIISGDEKNELHISSLEKSTKISGNIKEVKLNNISILPGLRYWINQNSYIVISLVLTIATIISIFQKK